MIFIVFNHVLLIKNCSIAVMCSYVSAVGAAGVQAIGNNRNSQVMGHVGHGSVH